MADDGAEVPPPPGRGRAGEDGTAVLPPPGRCRAGDGTAVLPPPGRGRAGERVELSLCSRESKREESEGDPFSLLGLPRAFALDPAELDRRYHELARRFHPDRFARAAPTDRRDALTRATALNDAYRTLRDPRRRAELLLRLCGVDVSAEERSLSDPDFLEAQLDVREELAAARTTGDAAAVACIAAAARARLASADADLSRLLADGAPDARARQEAVALLLRARFDEGLAAAAAPR